MRDGYYWIYFFFILFTLSFAGYFAAEHFYLWSSFVGILFSILLFFLAFIPFSNSLAKKLSTSTSDRGLEGSGTFKVLMALLVILPFAATTLTLWDVYGEKPLTKALGYHPKTVESIEFLTDEMDGIWVSTSEEAVAELYDFLDQYDVKRMNIRDWDSNVSKETGFHLIHQAKGNIGVAGIYEKRLIVHSEGHYYTVTNGPIDMDWVAEYNAKYKH